MSPWSELVFFMCNGSLEGMPRAGTPGAIKGTAAVALDVMHLLSVSLHGFINGAGKI